MSALQAQQNAGAVHLSQMGQQQRARVESFYSHAANGYGDHKGKSSYNHISFSIQHLLSISFTPPFLDLLLPLNMSSAEDLSYHHVSAGLGGNGAQSSPGINGGASQNGQPGLTKPRKKGRKPKGLDGVNGVGGANGANGTGGVGKRKSRESTFSFFNYSYNITGK